MTKSRNINAPRRHWTEQELARLRELYPHQLTADVAVSLDIKQELVHRRAYLLGIKKTETFMRELGGRLDGHRGSGTRFLPGNKPWSMGMKGLRMSPATEFKKGDRAINWMPLGTPRINHFGVLERKVKEGNNGGLNWEAVHRLVWKEAHGPIPKNHCVCFKPGRFTCVLELITLDAIELLTRKEVMLKNSIWVKNPELAQLYQLKGQITRQVNRIQKEVS